MASDATISLVQFSMQGHLAGVAAGQVVPVQAGADLGAAIAVEDLAGIAPGQTGEATERVRINVLSGPLGKRSVVGVQAPADLVSLPCSAVHPLPALLGARHQLKGLRALGWHNDDQNAPLVLLFDWSVHC